MLFIGIHLQRTKLGHILAGGVSEETEPAIGESDDADRDQNDPDDSSGFHV